MYPGPISSILFASDFVIVILFIFKFPELYIDPPYALSAVLLLNLELVIIPVPVVYIDPPSFPFTLLKMELVTFMYLVLCIAPPSSVAFVCIYDWYIVVEFTVL